MLLKILYWGARLNFMLSLPQLHTKSLCVLALQNSQFEASTSSRPQTVNFEALGHKAIWIVKLMTAVYPRLQGHWGNQVRTRSLLGVGIWGTPYQKLKSLRIWPTFFWSGQILCTKIKHRTWEGQCQVWTGFLLAKFPSKFQGSKSRWGKFPHFPQWWIRPWLMKFLIATLPSKLTGLRLIVDSRGRHRQNCCFSAITIRHVRGSRKRIPASGSRIRSDHRSNSQFANRSTWSIDPPSQ